MDRDAAVPLLRHSRFEAPCYDCQPGTPDGEHASVSSPQHMGHVGHKAPAHDGRALPGRAYRAKKARVQRWLVLHANGSKQVLTLDKRQLIQDLELDVPSRDMRLLDTHFSQYENIGQVSVNTQSVVFSIEHVKLIVTADKVIVPLEDDKNHVKERFVIYLEEKVLERAGKLPPHIVHAGAHAEAYSRTVSGRGYAEEELPFELQVLETALGEICSHLAWEVDSLQAQAQPALEDLTKDADTPVLERVRRIKTGHQRLLGRVKLVREVLERLMEDDGDMLRMCLTAHKNQRQGGGGTPAQQEQQQQQQQQRASYYSYGHSVGSVELPEGPMEMAFSPLQSMVGKNMIAKSLIRRHCLSGPPIPTADAEEMHDLLDVENLLESYFMLVDSTHQSLVSIGEYIDDTEDLINIQLDYSRNKLIRFDIILTAAAFALAIFNAVAGMLGENLMLPEFLATGHGAFATVNLVVLVLCAVAFFSIVHVLIKKKII